MFFLIDVYTGQVIQEVEGSFEVFLREKYGGWYPYRDLHTGFLRTNHVLDWAHDHSKYWSKYPPKYYFDRYICRKQDCKERVTCPKKAGNTR